MSAKESKRHASHQVVGSSSQERSHGVLLTSMIVVLVVLAPLNANAAGNSKGNPICQKLGKTIQASSGAQMFCFGPQQNGPSAAATSLKTSSTKPTNFGSNVAAATVSEDVTPSGVQIHGQSETSVAAAGPYVVEAWNDGTGFFAPCPSPNNKQELTGFAFSNNGGASFIDLGGLPNSNCATSKTEGDPSVEVYQAGGNTYFYISSIFIPFNLSFAIAESLPENCLSKFG